MTRWSPSPARHGSRKDSYLTAALARNCSPRPSQGLSTPVRPPPARGTVGLAGPAVIGGDRPPARAALWAIPDSLRRADNDFGLIDPTASYTYTATETTPPDDPLGNPGGPPRQLLPAGGAGHQTVAGLATAAAGTTTASGTCLG